MNKFMYIMRKGLMAISCFALVYSQCFAPVWADDATVCNAQLVTGCTDQPYFVVMGGDIYNGNVYSPADGDCAEINPYDSVIASTNINSLTDYVPLPPGVPSGLQGGAAEDGVITAGVDAWVASNIDSDLPVTDPSYAVGLLDPSQSALVFANKAAGEWAYRLAAGFLGGSFGSVPCMPDYYDTAVADSPKAIPSTAMTDPNTVNLADLSGGTYSYTETNGQPLIIDDGDCPLDDDAACSITTPSPITLAVNGNVYIANNITYNYANPTVVPQLNVYAYGVGGGTGNPAPSVANAYGNIYVNGNVSEIHGSFVAQGNNQDASVDYFHSDTWPYPPPSTQGFTSGLFSSCAVLDGSGYVTPTADYNSCDHKLTIYGAVDAVVFWLERDYGDADDKDANSVITGGTSDCQGANDTNACNAAEVFRYSPEVWLPDVTQSSTCADYCISNDYQAEVNLPPVF